MARGGQRGYGNAGRSAYGSGTRGSQARAVFATAGGFVAVSSAAASTAIESNVVTLRNLVGSVPLTITGGQYSKNGAAYSSAATTVTNGDTLRLRVTSSASAGTATSAVATIDGVARTFTVATAAATPAPTPTPTPAPGGDLTINRVRRVPLPTSSAKTVPAPDPIQDANTPAISTLSAPAANVIVLDPATQYQTFEGMGVQLQHATRYNFETHLTPTQADGIMTDLFDTGKATWVRGYIGPSGVFLAKYKEDGQTSDYYTNTGPVSDIEARDPSLGWEALLKTHPKPLNYDRQMEEFGFITKKAFEKNPNIKLFLTVATYPAWMKTGYNKGSPLDRRGFPAIGTGGSMRSDMLEIAARYACEGMAWHFDNDMPVAMFAPQNEPNVEGEYPTCLWSSAQLRAYAKIIGPMMKLPEYNTGKRKLAQVRLAIGECNEGDVAADIRGVLADPDAAAFITEATLHSYNPNIDLVAPTITAVKPGITLHQTEWWTGSTGPNAHSDMWLRMVYETFLGGYSSSTLFVVALDENGGPTTNNLGRRPLVYTPTDKSGPVKQPEFHMVVEMGRNVDVGAKRIFASDVIAATTVRTVAFKNPDGTTTAVLYNATKSSSRTVQLLDAVTGQTTTIVMPGGQVVLARLSQPAAGAVVSAPTALGAVGSETQVALSWTNPANGKGTLILRKTGTGAFVQVAVVPAAATSYTDTTTATGTTYTYAVQAIGNGRSEMSATVDATTSGAALPNLPNITLSFNPQPKIGVPTTITITGRASSSTTERIEVLGFNTLTVGADNTVMWTPEISGQMSLTPVSEASGYANSPYRSPTVNVTVTTAGNPTAPQPVLSASFTAPSGTVLTGVTDANGNFTSPPYQPEIGGPFSKNTNGGASDFVIGGNDGSLFTSGSPARADWTLPVGLESYRVDFTLFRYGASTVTSGVLIHGDAASDGGFTATHNTSSGNWVFQNRTNGNGVTVFSLTKAIVTGNRMVGSVIVEKLPDATPTFRYTYIVDGETVGIHTSTAHPSGTVGPRYLTSAGNGSGVQLTNLVVTPLA